MKNLLKLAKAKMATVSTSATVLESIEAMTNAHVGAVVVLDGEHLAGIFTERDLMMRVVLARRDPATTPVQYVMTSPAVSVRGDETTPEDVLRTMLEHHIRHLPVLNAQGKVHGVISARHLMRAKVEDLTEERESLEAYSGAGAVGG